MQAVNGLTDLCSATDHFDNLVKNCGPFLLNPGFCQLDLKRVFIDSLLSLTFYAKLIDPQLGTTGLGESGKKHWLSGCHFIVHHTILIE